MRRFSWMTLAAGLAVLTGCASNGRGSPYPFPGGPLGDVIVVDGGGHKAKGERGRGNRGKAKGKKGNGRARALSVPPGHYPPPGHCRVWFPGRPPGQQPAPTRCGSLVGRVPYGAFVLHNSRAWDTQYDWREHERRNRGSVPAAILSIVGALME